MKQQRLTPGLFALSTVLLVHCSPNFDDLMRGGAGRGGSGQGGNHSGGSSGKGGTGQAGSAANAGAPEGGHAGEVSAGAGVEEFAGASGMEGTMSAGAGGTAGKAGAGGTGGTGGTGAAGTAGAGGTSGAGAASGKGGTSGTGGTSGGAAGLVDDTCQLPGVGGGGTSGSGGTSGASGNSGSAGASGNSGSAGASGSGGTSGASGNSGSAGASGSGGTSGASGSAGVAGSGCVAPIPANGLTLFAFNDASAIHGGTTNLATLPPGGFWFAYGEPGGSAPLQRSTTDWSATEGHFCAGALTLSSNFTVYGPSEKVGALVNFPGVQNWSTPIEYTRLHAWLKVRPPSTCNLNHIASVQIAVNSNSYTAFNYFGPAVSTFADGQWHEVILSLKPPSVPGAYFPNLVNQLNIQMVVFSVAPTGTPVPVRTTLLIDDIWLEGP